MVYTIPINSEHFGDVTGSVLINDSIYALTGTLINGVEFNDYPDFQDAISNALGGSEWTQIFDLFYNNTDTPSSSQGLYLTREILKQFYPIINPAPVMNTGYNNDTLTLNNQTITGRYSKTVGTDSMQFVFCASTVFSAMIVMNTAYYKPNFIISFNVLPSTCINNNVLDYSALPSTIARVYIEMKGNSYSGAPTKYTGSLHVLHDVDTSGYIDKQLGTLPVTPHIPTTDPYAHAGDSDTGGGGGTWDGSSDPVPVPSLPSVGATNTGFISLFVPSQSQLKSVAEYMWGGLFDLSTWKRLFEDPMDCILGLSVVPVSVPTSGSANITVGNIELSGISLPVASQQYVEVDCGSLTVSPYFGSYLDYEPYTKMSLFVPYSGVHTVNADDIMGKTVNLVYHIDILTGSLVAFLKCGDSVLYEFNGACSSNIPVNSMNYASTIENAIRIATNIGTTVATAGASAPLSAGTEATKTAQNVARGISLAGSTADGALSLKPNIDRAGSLGGTTGLLGNQTPYFIVTRPRLCKPKDQNKIKGYPAFINYSVSDLVGKGYTEFDTILLKNLYLTDDEKNELESILMGGVYL